MRNILLICAMTAAICFAACGSPDYPRQLLVADSLCETNPHKAAAELSRIRKDYHNLSKASQWYYRLLSLKAKVKTYTPFTPADSGEVAEVLQHYEHGGDRYLLPYAYFYAGLLQRDLNNAPMAIDYLQKALNAMPDTTNLQLRSAINFRTGFLLLNQDIYDEALQYFKESYRLEKMRKDTAMMVYCLEKIAYTYDYKNIDDSALHYYDCSYKYAKLLNDSIMEKEILSSKAVFYLRRKDYINAEKHIKPYMGHIDEANKIVMYSMAAKICLYKEDYDSLENLSYAILNKGDIHKQLSASYFLIRLYSKKGDAKQALKYINLYEMYSDSVHKINTTETVARMNASYNYNKYKTRNAELKNKNELYIIYILLLVFFVILCGIFAVLSRRRIKTRLLQSENARINIQQKSSTYIMENEKKIAELQRTIELSAQKTSQQAQMLEQQKRTIEINNKLAIQKKQIEDNIKAHIIESDIYKLVLRKSESFDIITDAEWNQIEELILGLIPNFKTTLFAITNLSIQDFRLCLLTRLGDFSGKSAAALLKRSDSTISKAKKKLQNIFVGKRQDISLEEFIKSL